MKIKALSLAMSIVIIGGCSVTPDRITPIAVLEQTEKDNALIFDSQEPIDGPLDFSESLARAIKYNLNNRVQLMQSSLSSKNFELVKMDMLPILGVSAGITRRDTDDASVSKNIITGVETIEPTTSDDRTSGTADAKLVWNLLDFGISYYQAQQEADRFLISELGRKKLMLELIQQVRSSFWRTAAMQDMTDDIDSLLSRARRTLEDLREVRDQQLRAPLGTLQDLRVLIEIVGELEGMRQQVNSAEVELATLINVPPGSDIKLRTKRNGVKKAPRLPTDLNSLERLALVNSAEYNSELYNVRIDQLETKKSFLRMFPGLEFSYGLNYDSNHYLTNQSWWQAGSRVTWNIFRLLSSDEIEDHAEARLMLTNTRRLAVNMATVAKLHISWQEYKNSQRQLARAKELSAVDQDISDISLKAEQNNAGNAVLRIQNEARALRSTMASLLAYADIQEAYGKFMVSVGINPVPKNYQTLSVDELAKHLKTTLKRWEKGNIPTVKHQEEELEPFTVIEKPKTREVKEVREVRKVKRKERRDKREYNPRKGKSFANPS